MASGQSNASFFTFAVIGGGIAGVSCVEQILEITPSASILLISASEIVKEATNIRRLTKTLQDFLLVEKSLKSFKDVHKSVEVVKDRVIGLDPDKHEIVTESGLIFRYGKVCICSGASPWNPFDDKSLSISKKDLIVTIRDTQSVKNLKEKVKGARKVIVIGNGGIATEFVYEVDNVEIVWVIRDKNISAHFLDPGAAEFFLQSKKISEQDKTDDDKPRISKRHKYTLAEQDKTSSRKSQDGDDDKTLSGSALGPDWHANFNLTGRLEKKNVKILYETECSRLLEKSADVEGDWPIHALLSTEEVVGADLILCAVGVRPNVVPFLSSGIAGDEEQGLFLDQAMRTSRKDVYAAGDVCCPKWEGMSRHWFQMRLWTQARQMGLVAGRSMALAVTSPPSPGDEVTADFSFELFAHVTRFFGFRVVLLGLFNAQGTEKERTEFLLRTTEGQEYIKAVLVGGRMEGAVLIGETGLEETFENLILNQVDLSPFGTDLLNPDIDIEDYFD